MTFKVTSPRLFPFLSGLSRPLVLTPAAPVLGFLLDLSLAPLLLVVVNDVEEVVDRPVPLLARRIDRVLERHGRLFLAHVEEQRLLDPADCPLVELLEAGDQHQHQQVDEDVRILADLEESLAGKLLPDFLLVFGPLEGVLPLVVPTLLRVEDELEGLLLGLRGLVDEVCPDLVVEQDVHAQIINRVVSLGRRSSLRAPLGLDDGGLAGCRFLPVRDILGLDQAEVLEEVVQLVGQDERLAITGEPQLLLAIAQKVAEVDVEKGAAHVLQHEVPRVPVPDAQHVGRYALASQRVPERLVVRLEPTLDLVRVFGFGEFLLGGHVRHEVIEHAPLSEGPTEESFRLVHVGDDSRLVHELDVAGLEAGLQNVVAHHAHVVSSGLPEAIHDLEELQDEVVLPEVIAILEEELFAIILAWFLLALFLLFVLAPRVVVAPVVPERLALDVVECCFGLLLVREVADDQERPLLGHEDALALVAERVEGVLRGERDVQELSMPLHQPIFVVVLLLLHRLGARGRCLDDLASLIDVLSAIHLFLVDIGRELHAAHDDLKLFLDPLLDSHLVESVLASVLVLPRARIEHV